MQKKLARAEGGQAGRRARRVIEGQRDPVSIGQDTTRQRERIVAAQKELERLRASAAETPHIDQPRAKAGRVISERLQRKYDAATRELEVAAAARANAMKKARRMRLISGERFNKLKPDYAFGNYAPDDDIPLAQWRNTFLEEGDSQRLKELVDDFSGLGRTANLGFLPRASTAPSLASRRAASARTSSRASWGATT